MSLMFLQRHPGKMKRTRTWLWSTETLLPYLHDLTSRFCPELFRGKDKKQIFCQSMKSDFSICNTLTRMIWTTGKDAKEVPWWEDETFDKIVKITASRRVNKIVKKINVSKHNNLNNKSFPLKRTFRERSKQTRESSCLFYCRVDAL